MKTMTEIAHDFLVPVLHRQAVCVDGTLGAGMDARFFLSHHAAKVFAFEIVPEIAQAAGQAINDCHLQVFACSHALAADLLAEYAGKIDACIFNFGYFPKQKDGLTTKSESSRQAVETLFSFLKIRGRMALVFYPHEEGQREAACILERMEELEEDTLARVLMVRHPFKDNAPWVLLVEKRHEKSRSA